MVTAQQNPFRTSQVESLPYIFLEGDWSLLLAQLAALEGRGAIVGPHGSGKTTLLENLKSTLERQGEPVTLLRLTSEYYKLSFQETWRLWRSSLRREWILLDGAEQLGGRAWLTLRLITHRARGVVITSHREGRLPTLWSTATQMHTVEALLAILEQGQTSVSASELRLLFNRHKGNVREIFRECYFSSHNKD